MGRSTSTIYTYFTCITLRYVCFVCFVASGQFFSDDLSLCLGKTFIRLPCHPSVYYDIQLTVSFYIELSLIQFKFHGMYCMNYGFSVRFDFSTIVST